MVIFFTYEHWMLAVINLTPPDRKHITPPSSCLALFLFFLFCFPFFHSFCLSFLLSFLGMRACAQWTTCHIATGRSPSRFRQSLALRSTRMISEWGVRNGEEAFCRTNRVPYLIFSRPRANTNTTHEQIWQRCEVSRLQQERDGFMQQSRGIITPIEFLKLQVIFHKSH